MLIVVERHVEISLVVVLCGQRTVLLVGTVPCRLTEAALAVGIVEHALVVRRVHLREEVEGVVGAVIAVVDGHGMLFEVVEFSQPADIADELCIELQALSELCVFD